LSPAEVGLSSAKVKVQKYLPPPKRPLVKVIKEDFPDNVKTLVKLERKKPKSFKIARLQIADFRLKMQRQFKFSICNLKFEI
jgi:hypothetical protein